MITNPTPTGHQDRQRAAKQTRPTRSAQASSAKSDWSGPIPPDDIADFVRLVAGYHDATVGRRSVVRELTQQGRRHPGPDRAQLYTCAGVVVKLHPRRTDVVLLVRRLQSIARPDVNRFWIQPLRALPMPGPRGWLATIWPHVGVLTPTDQPPWTHLGTLLATLHQTPPSRPGAPPSGAPARLARATAYLRQHTAENLAWLAELGDGLIRQLRQPSGNWAARPRVAGSYSIRTILASATRPGISHALPACGRRDYSTTHPGTLSSPPIETLAAPRYHPQATPGRTSTCRPARQP